MGTGFRPLTLIRRVVDALAIAIVVLALGTVVLGRLLPLMGHQVFVVGGPSMEPQIGLGAAVVLETVDPTVLAVGDVVSLRSGPEHAVFTHRIVRVAARDGDVWLETKGDANATSDPSISPSSAVIGRVVTVIPAAGFLLALVSTLQGVVFVIATGATLLVIGWLLESIERDRRQRTWPATVTGVVPPAADEPPLVADVAPIAKTPRAKRARQRTVARTAASTAKRA